MGLINILDEENRYVGFKHNPRNNYKQLDTHTYSYKYMRDQYKLMGHRMGLDNLNKLIIYQISRGLEEVKD